LALYHAISWASGLGLQNVLFETDCKSIVDHLSSPISSFSDFNVILSNCRENLTNIPNSMVNFIRIQVNLIAHNLARGARCF
ncbi:hypothetical protein glysoja_038768, partial [Glycine soja]